MHDIRPADSDAGPAAPRRTPTPHSRGRFLVTLFVVPLLVLGLGGAVTLLWRDTGHRTPNGPVSLGATALRARHQAPAPVTTVLPDLQASAFVTAPEAEPQALPPIAEATPKKAAPTTVTAKDIHATLVRRTAALRKHNEKAFLATFDPAKPKLVATERILFRNLVKLPLASATYLESGVTGSKTTKRSYVTLLHQFRGVDLERAELSKTEQWIRRKGVVVTTAVSALRGQPATRYAPLDQVPLNVVNGKLVTLVGTKDVDDLGSVAGTAEKAAREIKGFWGNRPGPSRFILFVTHDKRAIGTWFGASNAPFTAVGVTLPQVAILSRTKFAGARVVVDLNHVENTEDLYRVLRHEFTHAVDVRVKNVGLQGDPDPVTWGEEGFAAWVEELDLSRDQSLYVRVLRQLRSYWKHTLPPTTRSAFYVDGDKGAFHYAEAAMVYRFIKSQYGQAKAIAVYSNLATGRTAAAWAVLGTDQAGFTKAWSSWMDTLISG